MREKKVENMYSVCSGLEESRCHIFNQIKYKGVGTHLRSKILDLVVDCYLEIFITVEIFRE